jgi:hypothetical protein
VGSVKNENVFKAKIEYKIRLIGSLQKRLANSSRSKISLPVHADLKNL